MKNRIIIYLSVCWLGLFSACDYLDVVPDNIATIDNAFTGRTMAEKYLFTCYSYMPAHGDINSSTFLIADEFWARYPQIPMYFYNDGFEYIARGNQGVVNPSLNYWDGLNAGKPLFAALRDCNIFLERMKGEIPGLKELEKKRWIAEVKFLKAYYHYWLLRMYGPIPLIRENLPVSASVDEVQVFREPVDDCFDYIVSLLDEAIPDLPLKLDKETTEMGRATKPAALAVKAKVLVEAASPLFNGNTDYASFKRKDGVQYFNQTREVAKWEKAATACLNAIDTCHLADYELYRFASTVGDNLVPELVTQMSIRNSVCENNYTLNREVVWLNPNSTSDYVQRIVTISLNYDMLSNAGALRRISVPMKIAEMFYTANGVPMEEDIEWESSRKYADRYSVITATEADRYHAILGAQTATLNLGREIRFYANLFFDGGLFLGLGRFANNNQWEVLGKLGNPAQEMLTGYAPKKLVHYRNVVQPGIGAGYTVIDYPWPVIRLADLYLLCAEALNEAYGPSPEAYRWIDLVRERAGLEGVVASWNQYARASFRTKPANQDGLRDIIQRERLIELANEGHRYWEIRRWKRGRELWNGQPIQGWDATQSETETYYRVRTLFTSQFNTKNYLWPIREYNLSVNLNLDQNPGW